MPILRRALRNLLGLGFTDFTIVTGFLADKVKAAIASWYPDLRVTYINNPDYATTNNAYSLELANTALAGCEFVLLDGDIIYDIGVLQKLIEHGPDCLALRTEGDIGLEEVKVSVAGARITAIGKEVPVPEAVGESVGIEYFSVASSNALFAALADRVHGQGLVDEYYEASFQQMFDAGVTMNAIDIAPYYAIEIDTRDDLAAANRILLARRSLTDAAAV
jgi:choline kinase